MIDYEVPAEQKDLDTLIQYQDTNMNMQMPYQNVNMGPQNIKDTTPLPMTTGGQRLNG